jgi:formate dehydrogenase
MKDVKSRVGNYGTVNDAFPGGIMADEMLTPGDKQIKALFVSGGNPLITMSDSEKLKKAFNKLDLLVCLDIQFNETCTEADYVLPCTDPFQRPDLPFVFPLMLGMQVKPYLQATDAVVPPRGEQRDEASIYVELAKASGFPLWGSVIGQKFFESLMRFNKLENGQRCIPQKSMLNGLLKLCGQPGFKKLLKNPHGLLTADHKAGSFLGKRVYTKDKKIDLAPKVFMETLPRLNQSFGEEKKKKDSFRLIIKRSVRTHNSWTHNTGRMLKGTGETNFAYIHPSDAASLKIQDGELVDVSTKYGKLRLPAKYSDRMMPGSVAIPHGWGHQHAKGLETASKTKGVNVNILAGSGSEAIDPLSGMSKLTAIEILIEPAKGPLANTWSGMPEIVGV